jgi:Glycosyl transferase family 2
MNEPSPARSRLSLWTERLLGRRNFERVRPFLRSAVGRVRAAHAVVRKLAAWPRPMMPRPMVLPWAATARQAGRLRIAAAQRRIAALPRTALLRRLVRPPMWTWPQFPARRLRFPPRYLAKPAGLSRRQFAIVTPSFNHARFIAATIDSVLGQDHPAVDYLVKDAGSADGTLAILQSYGARLRWLREPDRGQAHAVNVGFQHVEGDLMGWLNSDDMLTPGALSAVAGYFDRHPEVDLIYGHRIFIDADGMEIGRAVLPPHDGGTLRHADYVPQESLFWHRRVWEKVGGLDETFQYAMDWDFLLRAAAAGFRFARMPRFVGCFRVHDAQKTSAWLERGLAEQAVLRARWVDPNWTWSDIHGGITNYVLRQHAYQQAWRLGLLRH